MHYFLTTAKKLATVLTLVIACFLVTPMNAQASTPAACVAGVIAPFLETAVADFLTTAGAAATTHSIPTTAVTTGTGLIIPQGSYSVPISDPAAENILSGIGLTTVAHSGFQDVAKMGLDGFSYSLGQCALQYLTDSTIEWIKGGFNGSPNFAINPGQLFQDIADNVVSDFSDQIQGLDTCNFGSNFKYNLGRSVELSTRNGANDKFAASVRCNFPSSINPSEFYNDFNKGGWGGFEASLSDRGNSFGVKLATSRELATRQQAAQSTQEKKLAHSNGFLDIVDTSNCPDMPDRVTYGIMQNEITGKEKAAYQQQYCNTTTPGKMVSDQLGKSLGTDMDRLGFADNMNKIISALITQVSSQAMTGIFKR